MIRVTALMTQAYLLVEHINHGTLYQPEAISRPAIPLFGEGVHATRTRSDRQVNGLHVYCP